jgi:RNA polymerase sigma factor (sigma-70 family)
VEVNRIQESEGAFADLHAELAALVLRTEGKLRSFLRRFERDPQLVDDLVQDVYLEVLKSLRNFGGRSCLESWIFGVAMNVGRQHVAKAVAHRARFVDMDMDDGPADTRGAPDVFHIVAMQQRLRLVDQKMRAMPQALASTFEAYIEEGLTYDQTAKSLSIPIGTVRSRISRVRELVQDC